MLHFSCERNAFDVSEYSGQFWLILISDRKVGNDFRGRIVSGEAKSAEHNGHIWSRASTKHGAILAGKNPRFLLDISVSSCYVFAPCIRRKSQYFDLRSMLIIIGTRNAPEKTMNWLYQHNRECFLNPSGVLRRDRREYRTLKSGVMLQNSRKILDIKTKNI